jgi:phosphopantetheinyl transferase
MPANLSCTCGGSVRWAVNVEEWRPSDKHFADLLKLLPMKEQAACTRFYRPIDCKRALVSRLMQRCLGMCVFNVPNLSDVPIARTGMDKPYFQHLPGGKAAPNLNFNVSHEV